MPAPMAPAPMTATGVRAGSASRDWSSCGVVMRPLWHGARASAAQHLRHRLAPSQLVDELVEVADLLHEGVLDLLDPHAADHPRDLVDPRVELGVGEELLERRPGVQVTLERRLVEPGQPLDDLVQL